MRTSSEHPTDVRQADNEIAARLTNRVTVITPLTGDDGEQERLAATIAAVSTESHLADHLTVDASDPQCDWLTPSVASTDAEWFAVMFPGDTCRPGTLATLLAEVRPRPADARDVGEHTPLPAPGAGETDTIVNDIVNDIVMVYADHLISDVAAANIASGPAGGDPNDDATIMAIARLSSPVALKPAPSPYFLRGKNYVANAAIFHRSLVVIPPARGEVETPIPSSADPLDVLHELALRGLDAGAIAVPRVLFALTTPLAHLVPSRAAVARYLERCAIAADVTEGGFATVQVRYHRTADNTSTTAGGPPNNPVGSAGISVVIPTRGSMGRVWGRRRAYVVDAVASIVGRTDDDVEFVVVYDSVTPPSVLSALERVADDHLRLVEYADAFNFSDKINIGVEHAAHPMILLLNDDTELIDPTSLGEMATLCRHPGIGVVGARLLYEDGTLQHGGHTYSGQPLHTCLDWPGDSPGPFPLTPLAVTREVSGVTAAAAMLRRSVFDEVGGFSIELPVNFNDVDFCLRVDEAGYQNLWTPAATWYHFESVTRGGFAGQEEIDAIYERWGPRLLDDPFYNPQLVRKSTDWREPHLFDLT